MNRENIQKMIDTFKRLHHAPLPEHPNKGFNMNFPHFTYQSYNQHDCGTAACFHGWGKLLFGELGIKLLKLDTDLIYPLCNPHEGYGCRYSYHTNPEKFTLEAAITVLERLLETGEVDWNYAIDNPWTPDSEADAPAEISILDMLMMDTAEGEPPEGPVKMRPSPTIDRIKS